MGNYFKSALGYLGDAAHRRAIVAGVLILGNHLFGWTRDEEILAAVDAALAIMLAAWSSRTPALEEGEKAGE